MARIIRVILYQGLYWDLLTLRNYHLYSKAYAGRFFQCQLLSVPPLITTLSSRGALFAGGAHENIQGLGLLLPILASNCAFRRRIHEEQLSGVAMQELLLRYQ